MTIVWFGITDRSCVDRINWERGRRLCEQHCSARRVSSCLGR